MRKLTFLSFTVITFLLSSCETIDSLTQFYYDEETSFTIPGQTSVGLIDNITTPEVQSSGSQEFESNDSRADMVESCKLVELNLTLNSPEAGNFDFLNEINIYISAEGLPEKLIATETNVPTGVTQFSLETQDVDLAEYIKAGAYTLKTDVTTDQILTEDHVINVYSNFFVDAKILGQ
ncbi:hypothetical protein OO013_02055 [Mangrovivirga sp. M17]|uniref:Uncharacterized protein n=1 Tax=Mangrovivirga halotolerans TaxID=2993936 RepID=A0ABT3RMY0_9BACT|nr:hypothetical protein [Mangrovivirga halotolerans]MCX2742627.1 hypothetical protein [Mangrovivirga halotolerans]